MSTNNTIRIQEKTDELNSIHNKIMWRVPSFLDEIFNWLKGLRQKMNDQPQAKSLIDAGEFAKTSENWDRLREVNMGLLSLLPKEGKEEMATKIGFGL
jgi:molecular chaperone DnaK